MGIKSEACGDRAVDQIINDLTGRRALRQAWDEIDNDIQAEIRAQWSILIADAVVDSYESPEEFDK